MSKSFEQYLQEQRPHHLAQLKEFLNIPSVSTLSTYKPDVLRCAQYVADQLRAINLENVELVETTGNPVVYADWLHAPGKPTVLVYGHYDVQPAEPIELWHTPAFAADIRNNIIYARGASDDKGQVHMHIKACEALLATEGALPINLKFCFEGEEEVGSRGLTNLLAEDPTRFAADIVVVSDSSILGPDRPSVCYGLRGIAEFQIDIKGAKTDLHSGGYGGAVQNSIHALIELISTMRDNRTGKITIDGFYDDVLPISAQEKEAFSHLAFDEEAVKQRLEVSELFGEEGFSYLERTWMRPTLEVNGIYGGYQGEGTKTIIPAEAHAKITCRLVPNQDPNHILELVEAHIRQHIPPGVTISLSNKDAAYPYVTPIDHPAIQLATQAYEKAFNVPTAFIRMGGSIPIVETFANTLKVPVVLMGFALPTSNAHAPNENFPLTNFDRGLRTICHYWHLLAADL